MRKFIVLLALLLPFAVAADGSESENYCHDQRVWAGLDKLLRQVPNDMLVIRSYALRLGICRLIEEGKISLETGVQLFSIERQRTIMERNMEDAAKQHKKPLDLEDLEPRG